MTSASGSARGEDRSFFGHPRGLAYLAFTEAWERFSFYGMLSLLLLYMVQELLLPGHIENVAGMTSYRAALESVLGPMSTQALASQTFGFYAGLVYFTPIIGGWIADRWLGAKKTVVIGVALMTLGHFAMAFEASVLLALLLLILGSGCLKGNIAAQVGQLYPRVDESRSTRGYAIFNVGINLGAITGPLVCGVLAQLYGWHIGFGTAGLFMLIACAVYLAGQSLLPEQKPRGPDSIVHPALTAPEWRTVALLFLIFGIIVLQSMGVDQLFNVGLIWMSTHADLNTPLGAFPVGWFMSIHSFAIIASTPFLIGRWKAQAAQGREPDDLTKIATGAYYIAASYLVLVLGAWFAGEGRTTILLPILVALLNGLGFMCYWPTLLALVSRSAPTKIHARMMALAYLTMFFSSLSAGFVGTYYETLGPIAFWTLMTAIPAAGGTILLVLRRPLNAALHRPVDEPDPRSAPVAREVLT